LQHTGCFSQFFLGHPAINPRPENPIAPFNSEMAISGIELEFDVMIIE